MKQLLIALALVVAFVSTQASTLRGPFHNSAALPATAIIGPTGYSMVNLCADTIHTEFCMKEAETDCDCRPQTQRCDRHAAAMPYGAWLSGNTFEVHAEEAPCLCKFQCLSSGGSVTCEEDEDCEKYFTIMYGCPEETIEYVSFLRPTLMPIGISRPPLRFSTPAFPI